MKRLDELFDGLDAELPKLGAQPWPVVKGVSHDSRRIHPGDLYIAVVGERFDGRTFVGEAGRRGAVAVLGPKPEGGRGDTAFTVPWVVTKDPRKLMGTVGSRLYGAAHQRLRTVGVTGTNGKSTIVTILGSIFDAADEPTAVLGTLGYRFRGEEWAGASHRTTPEATDLHRMLAEMEDRGALGVAMEVSSHALALGRVDGMEFDVAVFTHLTRDHLDFHGDMEHYFEAKLRLFDQLRAGGKAVVHLGDPWGRRLHELLLSRGLTPLTFGEHEGDVRVKSADLDLNGIRAHLITPRGELEIASSLLGQFNLENLLACVAVAEAFELPHEDVIRGIEAVPAVDGRLEVVQSIAPFPLLVDYAHTPGALESALRSLRGLTDRRIAVVFGCGGQRDRGKRPLMGEVAGRCSDLAVLTSDNPRGEDPLAIIAEVEAGLRGHQAEVIVEADRPQASHRAVEHASQAEAKGEPWLVVVAGKGHETTQDLGAEIIPLDDREQLELAAKASITAVQGSPSQEPSHG